MAETEQKKRTKKEEEDQEEMSPEQRDKALEKVNELEGKLAAKKAELGVGSETADPTPGAVTDETPETEASDDDIFEPITVGTWAKLADTDTVADLEDVEVGALVRVTNSPWQLDEGSSDGPSPRRTWRQDGDTEITVAERGAGSREFVVKRADLEKLSTDRGDVLPIG